MKRKNFFLSLLGVAVIAAGVFAATHQSFILGRISMSFDQKQVTPAETDSLGNGPAKNGKKLLIAYFSWGGNTRSLAQDLHKDLGGDIYEIRTVNPYPSGYRATTEYAKKEIDSGILPELAGPLPDVKNYDEILIGYPIWWYNEPVAVDSFLKAKVDDLQGKSLYLFATSGGTAITQSEEHIHSLYPSLNVVDAVMGNKKADVVDWVKKNGLR